MNFVKITIGRIRIGNQVLFDGSDAANGKMNGFGKWQTYKLGNGVTTNTTYNSWGMPTTFQAGAVQNLNLNWNLQTGNLSSRADYVKGKTEVFTYDNLNRLTSAQVSGLTLKSYVFAANGNITSKPDVGNYIYDPNRINAVTEVNSSPTPSVIPSFQQDIIYTKFLRPEKITEGVSGGTYGSGSYELTYTYASDYERRKGVLKVNGSVVNTRLYMGDYEIDTKNGVTREIHYIGGGDGMCSIVVKENGSFNYYFPYTDHLGSILTVTNVSGTVIAEQNFDAWGRKRNVNTWDYTGVQSVPDWLYRGYTGHEHLPDFGLINMNARLYDPVLGRMLSPDNFVGEGGSQGFNRYSYAKNNPVKFIDPSGNDPITSLPNYYNNASSIINSATQSVISTYRNFAQSSITLGLNSIMANLRTVMDNAENAYFTGVAIGAKYGIINDADGILGWKPMYQNDLRTITDYYGMTGDIGYRFEDLFEGYVQGGGSFGAHWDKFLDVSSITRNGVTFYGGGQGSKPDFRGNSKYDTFIDNPASATPVPGRRDAWYELKAWRYGSTIELINPYSSSDKVYQPQAHIDNLHDLFGIAQKGYTSYLAYVTPAGVNVSPSVFNYGLLQKVYVIQFEAWYKDKPGGGYDWELRGKPILTGPFIIRP